RCLRSSLRICISIDAIYLTKADAEQLTELKGARLGALLLISITDVLSLGFLDTHHYVSAYQ
ncbi:hypothetical protein, partial [Vibrio fluvialis]|uniref:hypothetical protein n=1 Tax=Vibrio fluvialis TaxID=676 RepID=UPI001A9EC85C